MLIQSMTLPYHRQWVQVKFKGTPSETEPYKNILMTMVEKGKPLTLPEPEDIPSGIRTPFLQSLRKITPQRLAHLVKNDYFGVGEEISDIMYHVLTRSTLESGVFSPRKLKDFRNKSEDLLGRHDTESYQQLVHQAQQTIGKKDVLKLAPYFFSPNELQTNHGLRQLKLLKRFMETVLVGYAIYDYRNDKRCDLYGKVNAHHNLLDELHELKQHVTRKQLSTEKLNLFDHIPTEPERHQRWVKRLVNLPQTFIAGGQFTMENMMKFAIWKAAGRNERLHSQPKEPYDLMKQQAKAWEKILEAALFLNGVHFASHAGAVGMAKILPK